MKFFLSPGAAFLALSCFAQAMTKPPPSSGGNRDTQLPDDGAVPLHDLAEADGDFVTRRKRTNHCGGSTFINQGSEASPLISDCEQLAYNIRKSGNWQLRVNAARTVAIYETCAFIAETKSQYLFSYIGNEDIIDLIKDSIRKFRRHDDRVGSKGRMLCGKASQVEWGIYHAA